jgi:hypothetical protein
MMVDAKTMQIRSERYRRRLEMAAAVVPHGYYCYSWKGDKKPSDIVVENLEVSGSAIMADDEADNSAGVEVRGKQGQVARLEFPERIVCPYWKQRGDWPEQANGYCRLLKAGDNSKHRPTSTMFLWDMVKECAINPMDPRWEHESADAADVNSVAMGETIN